MNAKRFIPTAAVLAAAALCPVAIASAHATQSRLATTTAGHSNRRSVAPRDAATSGRPQLTVTMTDAQTQPYWERYWTCEADHGYPTVQGRGAVSILQSASDPAAQRACADLEPLEPIAENRALNPHYTADLADWISCMQADGLPVQTGSGPADLWTYGTATTTRGRYLLSLAGEPARDAIERSCELKAFVPDDHPFPAVNAARAHRSRMAAAR